MRRVGVLALLVNSAMEPTAAPSPATIEIAGVEALAAAHRLGRSPDRVEDAD